MKAYFDTRLKDFAKVIVPLERDGSYALMAHVKGVPRTGLSAEFVVPDMALSVGDARTFLDGCDKLVNYVGKLLGKKLERGGGRVKVEPSNDGETRVWNWDMDFYVAVRKREIRVEGFSGNAGHLMLVRKMVQVASKPAFVRWAWHFNRRAGH